SNKVEAFPLSATDLRMMIETLASYNTKLALCPCRHSGKQKNNGHKPVLVIDHYRQCPRPQTINRFFSLNTYPAFPPETLNNVFPNTPDKLHG
ncbi:MAG: hypothetical protein ACLP2X_02140, partial [Syntrophobacteraceae bacterium]